MADENDLARPITNREFGELKNEIFQSGAAAATIGAYVLRHLLQSDQNRQRAAVEQALQTAHDFEVRGHGHAATVLRLFAQAIAKGELFSHPDFSGGAGSSHDAVT
jgi:hypothetical protein